MSLPDSTPNSDTDLPERGRPAWSSKLQELGGGAWQRDLVAAGFQSGIVQALVRRERLVRELRLATDAQPRSGVGWICLLRLKLRELSPDEQQVAIDTFKDQPDGGGVLLWGITGSGKTEVYLQLAADELAAGRHVLLLTPEIGLIPQLVDRCRRRFGARVLEYHSGCTERERVRTWRNSLGCRGAARHRWHPFVHFSAAQSLGFDRVGRGARQLLQARVPDALLSRSGSCDGESATRGWSCVAGKCNTFPRNLDSDRPRRAVGLGSASTAHLGSTFAARSDHRHAP